MRMEATYSSEKSVDFQRTAPSHIPEEITLHNHRSENLKSYKTIEDYYILGYNAVQSVGSQPTFRKNISPPSPGSKYKPSKKPALLATYFMLVSSLAYSSSLRMEATFSSESSVDFKRTTLRHIPE
jgi:hypothetical protein